MRNGDVLLQDRTKKTVSSPAAEHVQVSTQTKTKLKAPTELLLAAL